METPLPVHVLIHRHELGKPSSTGKVVTRAVRGAVSHTYHRVCRHFPAPGFPADARDRGRELWILHPSGEPLPAPRAAADDSRADRIVDRVQILLLDGTWRQAGDMLRSVEGLGRCVRLSDAATEPSRFWLRDQSGPSHVSTAEALMGVLHAVGEPEAARRLRLHFEVHVYATLLARGKRELAERYLGHSPLLADACEVLDRLHARSVSGPIPRMWSPPP